MSPGDLARLRPWSSATQAPAVVVQRARILLLAAAIGHFCDGWNQRCRPLRWTRDAEQILATLERPTSSG